MIDVSKLKYKITLLTDTGRQLDITDITSDLGWEEDKSQLALRISCTVQNIKYNGCSISSMAKPGAMLVVFSDVGGGNDEVARGTIIEWNPAVSNNITFIKSVSRLRFQLSEPLASEEAAYKTIVNLTAAVPPGALLTVELCNNGYDEEPTWEDVSNSVKFGDKYFFQNTTKTAERWGYNIRVTLDRNGAEGDCYVQNIGGAFEYGAV